MGEEFPITLNRIVNFLLKGEKPLIKRSVQIADFR